MADLYINDQLIENYEQHPTEFDDESLVLSLPDHLLIEKKNCDRIVMDLDEDDVTTLANVFRFDVDKYINKKVRIYIQTMGNKDKRGR